MICLPTAQSATDARQRHQVMFDGWVEVETPFVHGAAPGPVRVENTSPDTARFQTTRRMG
ncbi:MAG: hypothetical protein AAGA11_03045 [Pseudomonadota bacterium]